jgi:hypothetical protein
MIPHWREPTRSFPGSRAATTGLISLTSVWSLWLGAAIAVEPRLFRGSALLMLGLGSMVVAINSPRAFLVACLVTLAYVPVYALPPIRHLPLHPAAVLAWLLAAGLLLRSRMHGHRTLGGVSLVDVCVVALIAASAASVLFQTRTPSDFLGRFGGWLGPYLALRLFAQKPSDRRFIGRAFALIATSLLPFVILEWTLNINPFRHFHANPALWSIWQATTDRLGQTRVQAGFAHPIALSMFLSTAAIIAVGLATIAETPRRRVAWLVLAVALAFAQAFTLSRTGWVVLVAGGLFLMLRRSSAIANTGATAAAGVAVMAIAFLPQMSAVRSVIASPFEGGHTSELTQSDQYRGTLYRSALQEGRLRAFGSRASTLPGALDSEYIRTAEYWGFAPAFLLLAIGGVVVTTLFRVHDTFDVVLLSACLANLVGLFLVALISQQQLYIWLLLGVAAAVAGSRRPQPLRDMAIARRSEDVCC